VEGERDYYSVEEAAAVLGTTPARVLQMLLVGELEGLPPGASAEGIWKVLLPATADRDQAPDRELSVEEPPEMFAGPPDRFEDSTDVEEPEAADTTGETTDEGIDEAGESLRDEASVSGWTTTKQAAKVLAVSRRSVQGYVRRGILEAIEEGEGVNKRFLISIASLNDLLDRRRREANKAAKLAATSEETEQAANLYANTSEALRHAIDRVEVRTAEATELRIRLEITEKAESTLRAELEEERRRREQAERERDQLRRELEAAQEAREAPVAPSGSPEVVTPSSASGGPQTAQERPFAEVARVERRRFWRRMFGR